MHTYVHFSILSSKEALLNNSLELFLKIKLIFIWLHIIDIFFS